MKNLPGLFQRFIVAAVLPLFAAATLTACSEDEEGYNSGITGLTVSEKLLTEGVVVTRAEGTSTFAIQSLGAVEATSSETWCSVEEATAPTAALNVVTVTVHVEANTGNNDRTAVITLTSGDQTEQVTLTQLPADGLVASTPTYNAPAEGGSFPITVTTNNELEVTVNSDWITLPSSRANMTDRTYTLQLEYNYGAATRTGSVTFTLGTLSETVSIVQAGSEYEWVGMNSDAVTLAKKMYAGINIGNTMEVPGGETGWGNPLVNKTYVDGLKAAGFNAVRIPCAWNSHLINTETNEIDPVWLDRVNEVVGYCRANDMYAIVNIHWDEGWLEESFENGYSDEINDKQRTLWTQIANKLNVYDEYLMFAGCNEPVVDNAEKMAILAVYEQTFVDAVRATGGNNATRCLIIQGPSTNIDNTYNFFTMPTDVVNNRLMAEVHFYDPYNFCLMEADEDWGNTFWYWGEGNHVDGSEHNPTWGEEDHVLTQFAKMKTKFADNGIPVILGEYSAMRRTVEENQEAHDRSRAYWTEYVTREAKNYGLVPFHWETGTEISRVTGEVTEPAVINGLMQGAADGNYPF